jgi:transcriptional regulator with XRE-family HTH domain
VPRKGRTGMVSLADAGVALGARLREIRLARSFTIAELAARSRVPASTISKIENGHLNPSLVNAINLATALDANLGSFVDQARTRTARYAIVRRHQRGRNDFREMALVLEDLNSGFVPGVLESRIGTIEPGAHSGLETMAHPGEEVAHVLAGKLTYDIDGDAVVVDAGDTLHFKSDVPHRWTNNSDELVQVLWIFSDGLSF